MNNDRRKAITAQIIVVETLAKRAEEIKALIEALKEDASSVIDDITAIKDEEDEYRDAMPESLQQSERYYTSEAASEQMDTAIDNLREICDIELDVLDLEEVITALDEAKV